MGVDTLLFPEEPPKPRPERAAFVDEMGSALEAHFTDVAFIGEGGTAPIFRGKESGGRVVALRAEYPPDLLSGKHRLDVERHRSVIERLAEHLSRDDPSLIPGVPTVFYSGKVPFRGDRMPYLAMQYVDGATLAELVPLNGPLPFDVSRRIVEQVCNILMPLHEELGIVHLDLLPQNVMLTKQGRVEMNYPVRVIDFGIATDMEISTTTVSGREIVAPEVARQLRDHGAYRVKPGLDVYALGDLAYYIHTGRHAFGTSPSSHEALLRKKERAEKGPGRWGRPPKPLSRTDGAPDTFRHWRFYRKQSRLEDAIFACFRKEEERYQSVREFKSAYMAAVEQPTTRWNRAMNRQTRILSTGLFLAAAAFATEQASQIPSVQVLWDEAQDRVAHYDAWAAGVWRGIQTFDWKTYEELQPPKPRQLHHDILEELRNGADPARYEKRLAGSSYALPMTLATHHWNQYHDISLDGVNDMDERNRLGTQQAEHFTSALTLFRMAERRYRAASLDERSRDDIVAICEALGDLWGSMDVEVVEFYARKAISENETAWRKANPDHYEMLSVALRRQGYWRESDEYARRAEDLRTERAGPR